MDWSLDRDAIERARQKLGVENLVLTEIEKDTTEYWGRLECDPTSTVHTVRITSDLGAHEASKTIWHELTHALQIERDFDSNVYYFDAVWFTEMERLGVYINRTPTCKVGDKGYYKWLIDYYKNPLEHEARHNERWARRYSLVTSVKSS